MLLQYVSLGNACLVKHRKCKGTHEHRDSTEDPANNLRCMINTGLCPRAGWTWMTVIKIHNKGSMLCLYNQPCVDDIHISKCNACRTLVSSVVQLECCPVSTVLTQKVSKMSTFCLPPRFSYTFHQFYNNGWLTMGKYITALLE